MISDFQSNALTIWRIRSFSAFCWNRLKNWVEGQELNLRSQGHNLMFYHWTTYHIWCEVPYHHYCNTVSPTWVVVATLRARQISGFTGGGGGIWTHAPISWPAGFQDQSLQPLGYSSIWRPRRELNPDQEIRSLLPYPLGHEGLLLTKLAITIKTRLTFHIRSHTLCFIITMPWNNVIIGFNPAPIFTIIFIHIISLLLAAPPGLEPGTMESESTTLPITPRGYIKTPIISV